MKGDYRNTWLTPVSTHAVNPSDSSALPSIYYSACHTLVLRLDEILVLVQKFEVFGSFHF